MSSYVGTTQVLEVQQAMGADRRGSVRLIRIAGIDVYLHWSWLGIVALLLLGFRGQLDATYPELGSGGAWALAALGTALFLGSVLVHELAHALMALARGIDVDGITLYLFGGATEADASSRTALDEFVIAIVGPLTSLGLAGLLAVAALSLNSEAAAGLVGYLAAINLILAVFNMTPGLPLDGGRVFRSIVWWVTGDFRKATRWAATAGVMIGYAMIGIGLLSVSQGGIGGLWLAAIGWMISQAAMATSQQEQIRQTFAGLTAADVMTDRVVTVPADTTVADVVRSHFTGGQHSGYPVVDGERVVGMLGVADIRVLSRDRRAVVTAGDAAVPVDPDLVVEPAEPMTAVIAALGSSGSGRRVLVLDDGRLVGILSPGDIIRRNAFSSLLGDD
jgi:Zn-dependent protease/CBS domain-containing protein